MSSKSREHHWWPVALQQFWKDRHGNVSWVTPAGKVEKKRVSRRKIAKKAHGHTALRGTPWEYNFEIAFSDADNNAAQVIKSLNALKPLGHTVREFAQVIRLLFKSGRTYRDTCKFYEIDDELKRNILLLVFSLLIRSPANRHRLEMFSTLVGRPPDEEVGKMNMAQRFREAVRLCERPLGNQFFVLIHSPLKRFIFGDGVLDWLTSGIQAGRIDGRALLPLTPNLCLYVCTPMVMRGHVNCASVTAAPWQVEWINDIVQIYSRDMLFFVGKVPSLTQNFKNRVFLEHAHKQDALIDILDEVAGNMLPGHLLRGGTWTAGTANVIRGRR